MFAIIEIHSGETVKIDAEDEDGVIGTDPALFATEEEAQVHAMRRFGPAAGREYLVLRIDVSR